MICLASLLLLLLLLVTAMTAIRAGRRRSQNWWIAAGTLGAGLVYVHPIAPLYAVPAFACGLVTDRPLRAALREARPGLVAAAVVGIPYVYALAVLGSRYRVGEAGPLSTTAGRTVAEEALRSLSPTGAFGLGAFSLLAVAGTAQLARERPRVAALLVAWVLLPIAFFTIVPAETRFFGRYVLPALPAFLVLVTAGRRLLGRRTTVALALAAAALALEVNGDVDRVRSLYDLDLRALPTIAQDEVLFSSTGSPTSRPPELLDDLVALKAGPAEPGRGAARDRSAIRARARRERCTERPCFPRGGKREARVWVFRGGSSRRVTAAERRFAVDPHLVTMRIGDQFLIVTSRRALGPRQLVELGIRVRTSWGVGAPADRWPRMLAVIDRTALG